MVPLLIKNSGRVYTVTARCLKSIQAEKIEE